MTATKTTALFICLGLGVFLVGCVSSPKIPPIGFHPGDLRMPDTLKVGDPAPDFTLRTVDGKREVRLSDYQGKKPVVLIFGSYT